MILQSLFCNSNYYLKIAMDRQSVITSSKRKQVNLDRTFSKKNLVEVPSDEEEIEILDRNSANVLNRTFNPNKGGAHT